MVMTALFKSNYFKTIFIPPVEIFEFTLPYTDPRQVFLSKIYGMITF